MAEAGSAAIGPAAPAGTSTEAGGYYLVKRLRLVPRDYGRAKDHTGFDLVFAGCEVHAGERRLHHVSPPGAEGVLRVPHVNDEETRTGRVGELDPSDRSAGHPRRMRAFSID